MTIHECISKIGWQTEVSGELKRYQLVDINFIDNNGRSDETQFLIAGAGTKQGSNELSELYIQFCKENHFKTNTVTGITIVQVSNTREELL